MSRSLKWFTPGLARTLGTTAPRLYEREQALARAGMLDLKAGRGPGSGIRATAPSVALLLIGTLATDSLSQTEHRTREIADATPVGADRCPLTGMRRFLDALANVIASKARSSRVIEITVSRTAARATIVYRDLQSKKRQTVEFVGSNTEEPALRVSATLNGAAVKQIASDVIDALLAPDESPDLAERAQRQRGTTERRSVRRAQSDA